MTAVWAWFRLDLRLRWRALVVLALLVAFASGTVMTALAGARRGGSALDRLLADTLPATVVALPNEPGFDWDVVRDLPEVAALSGFAVTDYRIDEIPPGDEVSTWFPSTDTEILDTIERPVVLEGRMLDPNRVDELVVTPNFLSHYGMQIGDRLTLRLFTPEQIDAWDVAATWGHPRARPFRPRSSAWSARSGSPIAPVTSSGVSSPRPHCFRPTPTTSSGPVEPPGT